MLDVNREQSEEDLSYGRSKTLKRQMHRASVAKQMSQQSLESLGHLEEKSESDDYEEDVSVFEVSP